MVASAEKREVVVNLYRPNAPLIGQCVETYSIVGEGAPGLTKHIVLSLPDPNYRYLEGQSVGIIPLAKMPKASPTSPASTPLRPPATAMMARGAPFR